MARVRGRSVLVWLFFTSLIGQAAGCAIGAYSPANGACLDECARAKDGCLLSAMNPAMVAECDRRDAACCAGCE
jgi:hypothetical protein